MIDPKELRIGNVVERITVKAWSGTRKDIYTIRTGMDIFQCADLNPIPITPEWLERLGFELRLPHDEENFVHWNFNGFEIWQHGEGFCHDFHFGGDIKYVHQLQNLVYSLTGQELIIKQ